MVVLGLAYSSGSIIFEVYDLRYNQGVLTCLLDTPSVKGAQNTHNMASWICFIEVDTVLPADTEVMLDWGIVEYDPDTFTKKVEQYVSKCFY